MTKLRIMSDLHLEFGPLTLEPIGEDILVLAGDIHLGTKGAEWAIRYSSEYDIPSVMVAGNHEFYNHDEPLTRVLLSTISNCTDNFNYIDNSFALVKDILFVGGTLWTDYNLHNNQKAAMNRAALSMNDHALIHDGDQFFLPEDAKHRHNQCVNHLKLYLAKTYEHPVIVITHHLPSARSLDVRYNNSTLNPAYASNLDDLVRSSNAKLWVHGHTHCSQDYQIGDTRVICNPRGYDGYELNPNFDPNLLIEIGT